METHRPIRPVIRGPLTGTAGAVPVRNEKGEMSMQKVKVKRYVAGERPKYARESDESAQSESEEEQQEEKDQKVQQVIEHRQVDDRRLRRLAEVERPDLESTEARIRRHRQIIEPSIVEENEQEIEETVEVKVKEESDKEEDMDEDERFKRRMQLRQKALQHQEELMKIEEEKQQQASEEESEDESEYEEEEYTDSDEDMAPRLKPVFVRKSERKTIQEREEEERRQLELERERERLHEESVRQTRKIIQDEVSRERLAEKENDENIMCDFATDDELDENDYETWKLRELKRIKRDREEKERIEKEKEEIQRIRNMTEEERLEFLKLNPKKISNKADKGKYKFLQKYYHRGAFFMDEDDELYKRNYAEPTLEDHFDKTILPKVMQVKNFGMAGRTKYTHLLDQDTTRREDDPWTNQEKFLSGRGGGTKQNFENPSLKRKK
ncbi:microfibrillar-associated 1 [Brachionus plicatilis]|uniref:Microfibrillar-associated 1 n=1 Tax=Brachionus plicatilis TaxID=10195 RepID=A0A3M7SX56_BRAPC|nr:microfibrillar-associated 1 [Brachionus plicatilis]